MHIGAIDIGTNSTHLLIADIDSELGTFRIELAEKSTTRLGERDPESGEITSDAMERVLETLKRFQDLSVGYRVSNLVTAATSAVREAPNGREFIGRIKDLLGIEVDLVSGPEEARLIYLGVLSGIPFGNKPHFLVDIGGGSTEIVLADGFDARALTSSRVGAVRLYRDFVKEDPIPINRIDFIRTFIQGSLEPAVEKVLGRVNNEESPIMVATSGTALAIGALIANEEDKFDSSLQGYRLTKAKLDYLVERLLEMTPIQRRKLSSINDRRAEIIVPGALILQSSMQMLGSDELILSERALREGLIVDWMLRNNFLEDRFSFQSSIRKRTVLHQVQRFNVNKIRAERIAKNAMIIYENSFGLIHSDKGVGKELLWAAAMLHNCGQHINLSSYHKHSWYLISNGELLGYSHIEHLMVAAIARYHRRSLPKKRHEAWQCIEEIDNKKIVFDMALILRLCVSLDRRPESILKELKVYSDCEGEITFELIPEHINQDLGLEEWSLKNCKNLIYEEKDIRMNIKIAG